MVTFLGMVSVLVVVTIIGMILGKFASLWNGEHHRDGDHARDGGCLRDFYHPMVMVTMVT